MTFTAGQKIRASDLNALQARTNDERYNVAGTTLVNGVNLDPVPFATVVNTTTDVTYSAGVYTVNSDGVYSITSTVRHNSASANNLEINLWVNTGAGYRRKSGSKGTTMVSVARTIRLVATNTFKIIALNTSGGNTTIETGAEETTNISVTRLFA
jgi:hypothetical protein